MYILLFMVAGARFELASSAYEANKETAPLPRIIMVHPTGFEPVSQP